MTPRKQLLHWIGWYFLISTLLVVVCEFTYLKFIGNLSHVFDANWGDVFLSWTFLIASYFAHATLLNLPLALITLCVALICPMRRVVFSVAAVLAGLLLIVMVIDRIAFGIYHMHNLKVIWTILHSGVLAEVLPLSHSEISLITGIVIIVIFAEFFIGLFIWQQMHRLKQLDVGYVMGSFLGICVMFSYILMAGVVSFSSNYQLSDVKKHLILKAVRFVPYYTNLYALLIPNGNYTVRDVIVGGNQVALQLKPINKPLQYPLQPMQCTVRDKLPNIIFIVVDTWRFDAMTKKITPHIFQFANQSLTFRDHYSGGNCTLPGIFSLFYGLPANYWDAMLNQHKSPVLLNELQRDHYQFGIYVSASLEFPRFNKTVFLHIPNVRMNTPGSNTQQRDQRITKDFLRFLTKRDKQKPFFGFLFYDAVHNYCEGSVHDFQTPFKPAIGDCARFSLNKYTNRIPYENRYLNAVHFDDGLIGKVLKSIKQHHLFKHSIIVITSDHGTEFSDEYSGFWGHGNSYTKYQLHVPMLIHWPGHQPQKFQYFTDNMDIAPTLLKLVLGCHNTTQDYSVGHSMFVAKSKPYLVCSSYNDYAVVTKHRITRIYQDGDYTISQPNGKFEPYTTLDPTIMNEVYQELTAYFNNKVS